MRLKKIYVSNYKNLRDFEIRFNVESFFDIIIGKNGSGKSNLFELIIELFQSFLEGETLGFDFSLLYLINKEEVKIEYFHGVLLLNDKVVEKIDTKYLPEHIIIYYSGHNYRVKKLIDTYEETYKQSIKNNEPKDFRFFIGITEKHRDILLLNFLLYQEQSYLAKSIFSDLFISEIDLDLRIVFKAPYYYKVKLENWDIENPFWGIKGYLKTFLDKLQKKESHSDKVRKEGFIFDEQKYYFHMLKSDLDIIVKDLSPIDLFQYLDDLRVLGMLESIDYEIILKNKDRINTQSLSDGEIQTILFGGIIESFRDKNCITLMDEPDSFLHPEWQSNLVKQMQHTQTTTPILNNILLTSHCASTIIQTTEEKVKRFIRKDKISCNTIPKFVAVSELSGGKYFLDSKKQMVNILHEIESENKPILLTEGHTDQLIIDLAWNKLKNYEKPFTSYYTFSCNQVRNILQNDRIYTQSKLSPFFGLFDFDSAYSEWNSISGVIAESDATKGIAKKIDNRDGYAILLPVPVNEEIRRQVIKNNNPNETFEHEALLSIELMFYGFEETNKYYVKECCRGGGEQIVFKGDKDRFVNEIIPKLNEEAFKPFEPLFDFIESKILVKVT